MAHDSAVTLRDWLAAVPAGPYNVVQRANPGWRLETPDRRVLAYGEENPQDAGIAILMMEARDKLPGVLDELDALRWALPHSTEQNTQLKVLLGNFQRALNLIAEGIDDESLPDWFSIEVRKILDSNHIGEDLIVADGSEYVLNESYLAEPEGP